MEMETQRNRANIYKILSICYGQPTNELRDLLEILRECVQGVQPNLLSCCNALIEEYTAQEVTALQVDHARLFVGPFQLLAAPFGSVYLDRDWKVMGESTLDVMSRYQEAGLEIHDGFKSAPDHISAELEFMYFLIFRNLDTGETQYYTEQERFLFAHLGQWITPFTESVKQHAGTGFFRQLAALTQEFVLEDMRTFHSMQVK